MTKIINYEFVSECGDNMPQGLQTFDINGNIIIDVTTRLQKYLGIINCPANQNEGSVWHEDLSSGAIWYLIIPNSYPEIHLSMGSHASFSVPTVWKDGNYVRWKFSSGHVGAKIIYGVY